ncbi:aspartic peptidase domain-containing protein [Xylariaceae sp. FL0804]|nr:aspartic peptidase domain-containing protein [Xylariaceae sp. FL0804]
MKASVLYSLAALGGALLLPLQVCAQVRVPFTRHRTGAVAKRAPATRRAQGSSSPPNITFFGGEGTYIVNATIGTPPQALSFALTLSADESWVPDVEYCDPDSMSLTWEGCIYGSYQHNKSSTYVSEDNEYFDLEYVDDNWASGDTMRETIGLPGGASVSNLTMGLASEASQWMAVMALGLNSSHGYTDSYGYSDEMPTLPGRMVDGGLINSTAYSMWLDDEAAGTGNILFGAIDTAAIDGTLKRISIKREQYDEEYETYTFSSTFDVYVQAFNYTESSSGVGSPLIQNTTALPLVTIDPTYSVSVLPDDLATAIWRAAGADTNAYYPYATVPCAWRGNLTGQLSVQLDRVGVDGGPVLTVPLGDLVLSEDYWSYDDWSYGNDYDDSDYDEDYGDYDSGTSTEYCLFGVQSTNTTSSSSYSSSQYTLGGGMLKRAYMVFDLANEELAIAPVKFNAAGESIVAFASYGAAIPESTGTTNKCYGCPESSSASSGSDSSGSSGGLPGSIKGLIAGLSIVAAVMVGVAIWGIVMCCRASRKGVANEKGAMDPVGDANTQEPAVSGPHGPGSQPDGGETAIPSRVATSADNQA